MTNHTAKSILGFYATVSKSRITRPMVGTLTYMNIQSTLGLQMAVVRELTGD